MDTKTITLAIIVGLILSPLIIYMLGNLFSSVAKGTSDLVYESTKIKGQYDLMEENLPALFEANHVYDMEIVMRIGDSARYCAIRLLDNDFNSYKSINLVFTATVDTQLKLNLPAVYTDNTIRGKDVKPILQYLIGNCRLYSCRDYPKDKEKHYYFDLNKYMRPNTLDRSSEAIFNEIDSLCNRFYSIHYYHKHLPVKYRREYEKLVRENNWHAPKPGTLPQEWLWSIIEQQ